MKTDKINKPEFAPEEWRKAAIMYDTSFAWCKNQISAWGKNQISFTPGFNEMFDEALDTLPERNRDIVQKYFRDRMTFSQIADLHGTSRSIVRHLCIWTVWRVMNLILLREGSNQNAAPQQAEELKVGIDINSLPLSAQIQVRAKLDEQKREQNQQRTKKQSEAQKRQKQPKEADSAEPSKYRNVKVFRVVDGETVKFPSKREARRFDELYLQYKGGAIQDLRLQQDFTLVEGYTRPNGKRVRPMVYKADFVYLRNGKRIVEDAKGKRTEKYLMKRKLMLEKYGIEISEV